MTHRFLYFDLGNVLLDFDHRRACSQMSAVSGASVERIWETVFGSDLEHQYERGDITCQGFFEEFCADTGSECDFVELREAASRIFEAKPLVEQLVMQLRQAGHELGILSNTNPAHWDHVRAEYPIVTRAFGIHALSYELRAMKPEPSIYAAAARLVNCSASEIFFVDDRPENVAAACQAGWDAVLFRGADVLQTDLEARNLL